MNDSDLAAARALAEKATPGKWGVLAGEPGKMHAIYVDTPASGAIAYVGARWSNTADDAEFISRAHELVPLLVTEIENRDAEIARLRAEMEADRANAAAVLSDHGWTERFGKWGCDAVESMADALEEAERGSNK